MLIGVRWPREGDDPMKAKTLARLMNWWPPFLGAGIRVRTISDDWRHAQVEMSLKRRNRNYVGTHFGGSLFAMTDPFYMIMLAQVLGRRYWVWDRAASIEFLKPGRGTVRASFDVDDALIERLIAATAGGEKHLEDLVCDVVDEAGDAVARVHRTLYVRLKPDHRPGNGRAGG